MEPSEIASVVLELLKLAIRMVGPEQTRAQLDALVVRSANLAADEAERLKFPDTFAGM